MTIRTTRTTVTFRRAFVLAGLDEEQPAGVYDIETDEERLEGLSLSAYRRVQRREAPTRMTSGLAVADPAPSSLPSKELF